MFSELHKRAMGSYYPPRGCSELLLVFAALLVLASAILGAIYRDELREWEFEMWKDMGVNPDLAMGLAIIAWIVTQCLFAWRRRRNQ
jgi:hypothetical protein